MLCRPSPPEDRRRDLIDGMCNPGPSGRACRDLLSSGAALVRAGVRPWSLRRPLVTIVMGLDQHRAQITADWVDVSTQSAVICARVWRRRIAPGCAGSLSA